VAVVGTAASLLLLGAVLALVAWGRLPDVLVAGVAAVIVVGTGLVGLDEVGDTLDRLAPTLAFLAAVFVLAEVARQAGVFRAAGAWMGQRGRTSRGLVVAVSGVAVLVTVLMSLDATAVLFTPVVVLLVAQRDTNPDPPLLATTQLANASSSLLPISNLTNLLVFSATGLSFGGFALRMALPTLAASSVVVGTALRSDRHHRTRIPAPPTTPTPTTPVPTRPTPTAPTPTTPATAPADEIAMEPFAWFVVGAIAVLTVAFFVGSAVGVAPAWIALGGAAVVGAAAVARRRATPSTLVRAASPGFLVFVVGLAVVVQAAVDHGLGDAARDVLPTGAGLAALLGMALVGAVLANLVNNVPATLVLASVVPSGSTALLLAMLLGVNVGPNLTYTGSLATLLWRRVVRAAGVEPSRGAFFRFALFATPLALVLATLSLWLTLQVTG
jgi:arsenical pump membrane protein